MSRERKSVPCAQATQIVNRISGRNNLTCYEVLRYAIDVSLEHYPEHLQMKVIDREVARKAEMTVKPMAVSRALARAAADIWENGCREQLEQIYGHQLHDAPSALSIIHTVSDYLANVVEYKLIRVHGATDVCVIVGCNREQNVAVAVDKGDPAVLMRITETLNRGQVPIDAFLEFYFENDLKNLK